MKYKAVAEFFACVIAALQNPANLFLSIIHDKIPLLPFDYNKARGKNKALI